MKYKAGQGLIELVVSIGVIVLVLSGTVSLLVFTMGKRNKGFDRSKASRLAEVVVERLVDEERNDPEKFWLTNESVGETLVGFEGYSYSISYTYLSAVCEGCVETIVSVGWSGADQELEAKRFFAK